MLFLKTAALCCLFILTSLVATADEKLCSAALKPFITVDEVHWVDGIRPSKALFQNQLSLHSNFGAKLKGDYVNFITSFEAFGQAAAVSKSIIPEKTGYSYRSKAFPEIIQSIQKNKSYDEWLLSLSSLDSNPREVAQIMIRDASGKTFSSAILSGAKHDLANKRVDFGTKDVFAELVIAANIAGITAFEIELNHTHPMAQLALIKDSEQPRYYINPLSRSDITLAKKKSLQFKDIRVTMRAITPGGFVFSATFLNGAQITL